MKRKTIGKIMAMALCVGVVLGNGMSVHAYWVDEAGTVQSDGGGGLGDESCDWSDDPSSYGSSDTSSNDNYVAPSQSEPTYEAPSNSEPSYVAPTNDTSSNSSSSTSSDGTASAPVAVTSYVGSTAKVPGYETFRQVPSRSEGLYRILHKGVEQYTGQLRDADGNAVGCTGITLHKADDGKWYINYSTAVTTDSSAYTVETAKGATTYLPTLGVSGVMVDGRLVVDAVADKEAAATAATGTTAK